MKPQKNDFSSYIYIIIVHPSTCKLVFLIFEIKYCPMEVLEQPEAELPALNIMAIRDQHHTNVSKPRMLLDDVDVAPPQGTD